MRCPCSFASSATFEGVPKNRFGLDSLRRCPAGGVSALRKARARPEGRGGPTIRRCDDAVTSAGLLFGRLTLAHLQNATGFPQQSQRFKPGQCFRHAGSAQSEDERKTVVRNGEYFTTQGVAGEAEPACQTLLKFVPNAPERGLRTVNHQRPNVAQQVLANLGPLVHRLLQIIHADPEGVSGNGYDRSIHGTESNRCTDRAMAAHHGGLQHASARKRHQRDDAGLDEIGISNMLILLVQNRTFLQGDRLEEGTNRIEVLQ
jgi:hypothetical protein